MGIQGLLPLLKSTTSPVHIKEYSGKVAAVDTYSWLHKGAIACSRELCQGLPTTKFIDYCMNRVNLLREHGVKPLLVFDGGLLPMKEEQETKRARSRKSNLERALEHELSGNTSAAYDCFQKAVDITPQIAYQLIKVLQEEHIAFIVAPYEADAQMAFLSIQRHVDVVITEDSDAIPFGCLKILFKMDKYGQGVEFQYDDLAKNKDLNFTSFTKQMILEMCILSGCDYLPSLQGMGLKRAHGLIRRFRNYQKIFKHLKYNGVRIPSSYEEAFTRSILTFRHQWVYDPILEDVVHLNPLPSEVTMSLEFLGPPPSQKLGQAIARGEVDPITGLVFESQSEVSISKAMGAIRQRKRELDLPIQKNLLTSYFLSASTEAKRQFKAPRNSELDRILPNAEKLFSQSFNSGRPLTKLLGQTSASTIYCRTTDFSFTVEEEEQVLSFLNSKMASVGSPVSLDLDMKEPANILSALHVEKTKFPKTQGKCIVRSAYFSKSQMVKKPTMPTPDMPTEDITVNESCDDRCGDLQELCRHHAYRGSEEAVKGSDKAINKVTSGCGSQIKQSSRSADQSEDLLCKRSDKQVDHISLGKQKHIPIFHSKLLADSIQPGKFASDTSHVEQYACIARKSMERFVSTIAPFRCIGPGGGARASGLRRPPQRVNDRPKRCPGKGSKVVEDLRQFSLKPPGCRLSSCKEEPVPGVKSVNKYFASSEWD